MAKIELKTEAQREMGNSKKFVEIALRTEDKTISIAATEEWLRPFFQRMSRNGLVLMSYQHVVRKDDGVEGGTLLMVFATEDSNGVQETWIEDVMSELDDDGQPGGSFIWTSSLGDLFVHIPYYA